MKCSIFRAQLSTRALIDMLSSIKNVNVNVKGSKFSMSSK